MTNAVKTANQALLLLGERVVQSLEEDTTEALVINTFYEDAYEHCLRELKPSFARRRAKLTTAATTPDWGFDNAWQLPQDCLVVIGQNNETLTDSQYRDWRVEGRTFLSNRHEPDVLYISKSPGEDAEDASFRKVLAAWLAYESAYALTNSDDKVEAMFALYEQRREETLAIYGQESSTVDTTNDQLTIVR